MSRGWTRISLYLNGSWTRAHALWHCLPRKEMFLRTIPFMIFLCVNSLFFIPSYKASQVFSVLALSAIFVAQSAFVYCFFILLCPLPLFVIIPPLWHSVPWYSKNLWKGFRMSENKRDTLYSPSSLWRYCPTSHILSSIQVQPGLRFTVSYGRYNSQPRIAVYLWLWIMFIGILTNDYAGIPLSL